MLARAVADTRAAGLDNVAYVRGDAQELPFVDQASTPSAASRRCHLFADPMRALDRMTEVLTPGGRIAIFTSVRGRSAPLRTVESAGRRAAAACACSSSARSSTRSKARGFDEVRQRITGVTQFVGGTLAG